MENYIAKPNTKLKPHETMTIATFTKNSKRDNGKVDKNVNLN